jgi:hypothetical protein
VEPVKAAEPAKTAVPAKGVSAAKPAEPVKPAVLQKSVVSTQPAAPAKVVVPVKIVEPAKASSPAIIVSAAKPLEPLEIVIPVKKVTPAKVLTPVKATEPAKAVKSASSAAASISAPKPALKPVPLPPVEISPSVPAAKARRTPARRKKIQPPAILTESDAPAAPALAGPGEKFSLGPTPAAPGYDAPEVELPEAYGTKKLFLTARDPHWLYAHWDLTVAQQHAFNAESSDGHLVLRVYAAKFEGHPLYEIHVHPESRHWFVHVERAGNSYCAELGCYSPLGKWTRIAVSSATVTPPDAASPETDVEFATIPFEFPFAKLMQIIEEAVRENLPLAQAIEELRRAGHPDLPRLKTSPAAQGPALARAGQEVNGRPTAPVVPPIHWTAQQEQALAKVICIDQSRRIWMGSLEITELIRRRLTQEVSSPMRAFGGPGLPGALGVSAVTSPAVSSPAVPFGAALPADKSFWFNVNAELIIYGATEPGAKVTLGGHEIKLRPDGTFSYRFALPDGKYDLPAVAVSADGTDGRAADLKFSRETEYLGEVGVSPQDSSLTPPLPDNLPANL